jgi:uncharacterized protein
MPVAPTYPGVYIEEIPSGVRTIAGVSTSVAAFLGFFSRGPMDRAVQLFNMGDFTRLLGGLDARSEAAYAISQFFLNGGTEAWVVRTASGTTSAAAVALRDQADGGSTVLRVTASDEGAWGNEIRLDVDHATTEPDRTFNLVVTEQASVAGRVQAVKTETFRNLVLDADRSEHAVEVVGAGSALVRLSLIGSATSAARPAETGTVSNAVDADLLGALVGTDTMTVSLDGTDIGEVSLGSPVPATAASLASVLQARLRALEELPAAVVAVIGSASTRSFLQVKAGTAEPSAVVSFTGDLADATGLGEAARTNVQQYALGGGAVAAQATPNGTPQRGADGDAPDALALLGDREAKTGLFALEDVGTFNILCVPDTVRLSDNEAGQVASAATNYCEERRAFYVLDPPQADEVRDEPAEIRDWLDEHATLRHRNAAVYYPRPRLADPLNDFRLRLVATSGTVAGLYARTDGDRGVWKAPAGTEAGLRGVQGLEYRLSDQENGSLNPLAINCLRTFPVFGHVAWGARTLVGSDQQASEWKYVPVRRLALFMEESLYRGTQWVVFEPNDEPLWSQIRLNVGAFLNNLFRKGAFQGQSPQDAYFVKCDAETTTQNDIDLGIVNILVGFAPLKPAEFVIIQIQQIAGQIAT